MKVLMKFCIIGLCVFSTFINAKLYQFGFSASSQANESDLPKIQTVRQIDINGRTISAFNTEFIDSTDESKLVFEAQAVDAKNFSEQLLKVDLYGLPNGSVFVPKGWQLVNGGLGVNGSQTYTFVPKEGKGYFTYLNTGACVGCAMTEASLFFPEAKESAEKNDFMIYQSTLPVKTIVLDSTLRAYSVTQGEQRLDGIAYYDANAVIPFWKAEISLPTADHPVANFLLNQFISSKQ